MLGIFGGTFDPVHYGHLRIALEMGQALGLEEVRFVPCRLPPHRGRPGAAAQDRCNMLRLALACQRGFVVDERELRREGPSYMVDTLTSLREEVGQRPLCLMLGMDAFASLDTWHRWERLIELAHLVVAHRPGIDGEPSSAVSGLLARHGVEDGERLRRSPSGCILLQPVTQLEISATRIRELVRGGQNPRYLLPEPVLEYIWREGLYRE
ncbi:MAG TPA: nicotinate-nucleotide adenylyltransferase [Gammaproteobacteria bacterium]|nr:nicotinate-nucleotide adenylyltransferase [Gammaproteobacteria bacterium]